MYFYIIFYFFLELFKCNAVKNIPNIQPFHFPPNIIENQKFQVICGLIHEEDVTFSWLKNGKMFTPNSQVKISYLPGISIIAFNKISVTNTGNYTCIAKNEFGSSEYSAQLLVKGMFLFHIM